MRALAAQFRKCDAGADIRDRANLDGPDEAIEHVVEQRDLLFVESARRQQKKIRHAPDRLRAFFRGGRVDRGLDFADD